MRQCIMPLQHYTAHNKKLAISSGSTSYSKPASDNNIMFYTLKIFSLVYTLCAITLGPLMLAKGISSVRRLRISLSYTSFRLKFASLLTSFFSASLRGSSQVSIVCSHIENLSIRRNNLVVPQLQTTVTGAHGCERHQSQSPPAH